MDASVTRSLKRCEVFDSLPDAVIDTLAQQVDIVKLDKDQPLFKKGDAGDSLYVVQEGWVKMVSSDKDGQELLLNQEGPGAVIGEMALLDNEPRSAGVIAMTDAQLLKLSREAFLDVINKEPMLGMEISRKMIQRLRLATTYIELAIDWSKEIAAGNYDYVEQQAETESSAAVSATRTDRERATRFLSTFFQMVKDVRAREEQLKQELVQLKVEIDQQRRKQDVASLTESDFFRTLREAAKKRGQPGSEEEPQDGTK